MRLTSARIRGFQGFKDSSQIEFGPTLNLLVEQNNSGKSTVLRALQPALPDDRHHNETDYVDALLPQPTIDLRISISGEELRQTVLNGGGVQYRIPTPFPDGRSERYVADIFAQPTLEFFVRRTPGSNFESMILSSHGLPPPPNSSYTFTVVVGGLNGSIKLIGTENGLIDTLSHALLEAWTKSMFFFTAERMNISRSAIQHSPRLTPNASNLPAVLLTLRGERGSTFDRLIEHVREIFPTVGNVSIRPVPGTQSECEIRVWPSTEMKRSELGFGLDTSGTGVGQVLALLAAILTVDHAVIIIDEINSFLHPSAVKTLLRIIQSHYLGHQYIVSTHSPEVISSGYPDTVHLVHRAEFESHVRRLDLKSVDQLRDVASHLGISLSDVFAADRIAWVEGPTEEICFPLIYTKAISPLPRSFQFIGVAETGDFLSKKRDRALVYEIYTRLSQAALPLADSVAFSFDSENLSDKEKSEMIKESGGKLKLLPRRNIESYLIHPGAIANFIWRKEGEGTKLESPQVHEAIISVARRPQFKVLPSWAGDIRNAGWLKTVDGAKLIKDVLAELTQSRVPFFKKGDSLELLKFILDYDRDSLEELIAYVKDLVEAC